MRVRGSHFVPVHSVYFLYPTCTLVMIVRDVHMASVSSSPPEATQKKLPHILMAKHQQSLHKYVYIYTIKDSSYNSIVPSYDGPSSNATFRLSTAHEPESLAGRFLQRTRRSSFLTPARSSTCVTLSGSLLLQCSRR